MNSVVLFSSIAKLLKRCFCRKDFSIFNEVVEHEFVNSVVC